MSEFWIEDEDYTMLERPKEVMSDLITLMTNPLFSVVENHSKHIFILDPVSMRIIYTNTSMRNEMDRPLIGDKCHRTLMCSEFQCGNCPIVLNQKYGIKDSQEFHTPEGRIKLVSFSPLSVGSNTYYLISSEDITELRKQVAEAEIAKEGADRANRAKSTFLSRMSHDIRTPINGIMGMSKMARDRRFDPAWVEACLDKIDISARQLSNLVNDVLDLSKIESGQLQLETEPADISLVLRECIDSLGGTLAGRNFNSFNATSKIEYDYVIADLLHLKQVIINIISNAIKFTPDGGDITIVEKGKLSSDARLLHYYLSVADTGIGMTSEFRKRMFEPFAQADEDAARSKYKGTGLGLSLVKQIIDKMNGTISVVSEKGVGTTFELNIDFEVIGENELARFAKFSNGRSSAESLNAIKTRRPSALTLNSHLKSVFEELLTDIGTKVNNTVNDTAPHFKYNKIAAGFNPFEAMRSATDFSDELEMDPKFESELEQEIESKFVLEIEPEPDIAGMNILLAEDNELNREIEEYLLEEAGATVISAVNGREAVSRFLSASEFSFDAILMDVMMPEMNGYEATRAIRALPRRDNLIPIIAVTANSFSEDIERSQLCGMNSHLPKPIDARQLIAELNKYYRARR